MKPSEIKALAATLDPLDCCQRWLPGGARKGHEWVALNPTRADSSPGSFSVNLRSGKWGDFAADKHGGDLVSLYAYLHGLRPGEAADAIARESTVYRQPREAAPKPDASRVVMPIPPKAGRPNLRHYHLGDPSRVWLYQSQSGQPLLYVCRWDTPSGKELRPHSWTGKRFEWVGPSGSDPRPLYGLERLGDDVERPVLICEGEKAADAAHGLIGRDYACLAWLGGTSTADHVSLKPLSRRSVWLWPDADAKRNHAGDISPKPAQPGWKAMTLIAERLAALGVDVHILDYTPGERPDTWDAADAVADGWTRDEMLAHIDRAQTEFRTARKPAPPTEPEPERSGVVTWVHTTAKGKPLSTIENLRALLDAAGISVLFNQMTHRAEVTIPGVTPSRENADLAALAHVRSIARQAGYPVGDLEPYMLAIADGNAYHPVRDWVETVPWDGQDHVTRLFETVPWAGDADRVQFSKVIVWRWMLACAKALYQPSGLEFPFVLVLQGSQGRGKTRWLRSLCSVEGAVQDGRTINVRDKDSVMTATASWITELGEVDETMRMNSASALKAWLTKHIDVHRRPFAATDTHAPRRTAFAASVNPAVFLKDPTGNRRFAVVPLAQDDFDHGHSLPMQQVWAQVAHDALQGARHWLDRDEQERLAEYNAEHTTEVVAQAQFADMYDTALAGTTWLSVTEIAALLTDRPDSRYVSELTNALHAEGIEHKIRAGRRLWHVPPRRSRVHDSEGT